MWLLQALADDFASLTAPWHVQAFRLLFGLGCLWKFVETFRHGGWRRFAPATFNRHQLESAKGRLGGYVARYYRQLVVLRCLPALGVLLGVWTRACLVFVIVALAVELVYEPRKHPIYFMLNAGYLLLAGNTGSLWHFDAARSNANTWAQVLIALTTFHVYWNSAWMKLRSPQFRSGRVLAQVVHVAERTKDLVPVREYCLPARAWRPLSAGVDTGARWWRLLALSTITMEALLPIGLAWSSARLVFVVLGVGMHAAFTCLKPRGLVPFSLVTVASYLAFAA